MNSPNIKGNRRIWNHFAFHAELTVQGIASERTRPTSISVIALAEQ